MVTPSNHIDDERHVANRYNFCSPTQFHRFLEKFTPNHLT